MNDCHDEQGRFCSGSGAVPCPNGGCRPGGGGSAGAVRHGAGGGSGTAAPSGSSVEGGGAAHGRGEGGTAKRRINPSPGGGGKITFVNDTPGRPSTDHEMSASTAAMIEDVAREVGLSININSTTGGKHDPKSRHYSGRAVDINMVNGIPVSPSNPYVRTLQEAFERHPNIRENFGPGRCVKKVDGRVLPMPKATLKHRTHIHVSGQE
jgi:hypothetical protein